MNYAIGCDLVSIMCVIAPSRNMRGPDQKSNSTKHFNAFYSNFHSYICRRTFSLTVSGIGYVFENLLVIIIMAIMLSIVV